MAIKNVIKTKSLAPPVAAGEYFRLLCMTGKNKGLVYYLNSPRAVLGRSENADIAVWDQKSSREHCELVKHGNTYVMTDLDSQNGVVINDLKATQHRLADGDKIIIGQTVFKYNIVKVLPPSVIDNDEDEEEDYEDDDLEEAEDSSKDKKKKGEADPAQKRKKLIIAGVVVVILALFLGEGEQEEDDSGANQDSGGTFILDQASQEALTIGSNDDPEIREQVEVHIHRGLREYRERNYFRAIREFNLALVLSPNHGSASYYLSKTKQRLDEDVEHYFSRARQEIEALKYSEAVISYCSIIRLLQQEPTDQRYVDAVESLDLVREQMGARSSEVRCIEE